MHRYFGTNCWFIRRWYDIVDGWSTWTPFQRIQRIQIHAFVHTVPIYRTSKSQKKNYQIRQYFVVVFDEIKLEKCIFLFSVSLPKRHKMQRNEFIEIRIVHFHDVKRNVKIQNVHLRTLLPVWPIVSIKNGQNNSIFTQKYKLKKKFRMENVSKCSKEKYFFLFFAVHKILFSLLLHFFFVNFKCITSTVKRIHTIWYCVSVYACVWCALCANQCVLRQQQFKFWLSVGLAPQITLRRLIIWQMRSSSFILTHIRSLFAVDQCVASIDFHMKFHAEMNGHECKYERWCFLVTGENTKLKFLFSVASNFCPQIKFNFMKIEWRRMQKTNATGECVISNAQHSSGNVSPCHTTLPLIRTICVLIQA